MQTILVPVDFSQASANAARYAGQLAQALQAKLFLFHAYMLPTPVSEVPYVMVTADDMQKENEALLKETADRLQQDFAVETEWLVRIGIASDEIKILAAEKNAQFIVMGMKGAGGLEKMIGSTTVNVIRKVKTPVFVVPHDAGFEPIQKIILACDFNPVNDQDLLNPVLTIAKKFNSKLQLLHVKLNHGGSHEPDLQGRKQLEAMLKGRPAAFVVVEDQSVQAGIQGYIQANGGDLLVMMARKHSFLERLFSRHHSTAMAYETRIPMLVLEDKD